MEILCADCNEEKSASSHTCTDAQCPNAREHHTYKPGVVMLDHLILRPEDIRWLADLIGDARSWPTGRHVAILNLQNHLMRTYFEATQP